MNQAIALDTNVVIDILNGKINTVALFNEYSMLYLPVTVCGELLFGAKNSAQSQVNENKYKTFIKLLSTTKYQ